MNLKEIQFRNYIATVRRGLITAETGPLEFIIKMAEETDEIKNANNDAIPHELADLIIVCLCYAKHLNIDIETALLEKTIINEIRKD